MLCREQGRPMRPFACSALAACLSSAALAQSGPASFGLPSPAEVSSRDKLTVGAGVAWVPDYEGSNDYRLIPTGAVRGEYRGTSFNTNGTYLYVDVVPGNGKLTVDAGPIIGLRFDSRRRSDDPVVSRMVRRKTAIEAGGFGGISFHGLVDAYDTLSFRIDVLHDIGNAHKSTLFDPNLSFSTPVSRRTYISLSGGAEFVSRKYADYYFGVTPARRDRHGRRSAALRSAWQHEELENQPARRSVDHRRPSGRSIGVRPRTIFGSRWRFQTLANRCPARQRQPVDGRGRTCLHLVEVSVASKAHRQ